MRPNTVDAVGPTMVSNSHSSGRPGAPHVPHPAPRVLPQPAVLGQPNAVAAPVANAVAAPGIAVPAVSPGYPQAIASYPAPVAGVVTPGGVVASPVATGFVA